MSIPQVLSIGALLEGYRAGRLTPREVIRGVLERIERGAPRNIWISLLPHERLEAYAQALERQSADTLPLYGVPFAIKDNLDLEDIPTTAACPAFAYVPQESAPVVRRLIEAGAIPIGKTNLDQFATGLVGTRSPYGICANAFDPAFIAGGSSSGSAVAVAAGLVSFALGTDTAGSGRVPAAFNNLVGLKPTNGRLSTRGVVPACRSLDCVSVFALTAEDAARVCAVAEGYDAADSYSRAVAPCAQIGERFRFGVPEEEQLEFFGDAEYQRLFDEACARLQSLGGERVRVEFAPFRATAKLLYEGPWIAERYAAVGDFIEQHPQSVHPVTRQIISVGRDVSGVDAFRGHHRLAELERATRVAWGAADVLLTPTAGTIYRIAEIEAEPIARNATLGYYTNFVNFLRLAAVSVPAGFRRDGLPFGVTLVGREWSDFELLALADRLHRASNDRAGALDAALPAPREAAATLGTSRSDRIQLAVCGAHMRGLPLNQQLIERDAKFLSATRTVAAYRLYAVPGGPPQRPGLVRVARDGAAIDVEVWAMPASSFGSFVAAIPAPLGIGKVQLEDGAWVCGFLCESHAVEGARDITHFGGWRAYLTAPR